MVCRPGRVGRERAREVVRLLGYVGPLTRGQLASRLKLPRSLVNRVFQQFPGWFAADGIAEPGCGWALTNEGREWFDYFQQQHTRAGR